MVTQAFYTIKSRTIIEERKEIVNFIIKKKRTIKGQQKNLKYLMKCLCMGKKNNQLEKEAQYNDKIEDQLEQDSFFLGKKHSINR